MRTYRKLVLMASTVVVLVVVVMVVVAAVVVVTVVVAVVLVVVVVVVVVVVKDILQKEYTGILRMTLKPEPELIVKNEITAVKHYSEVCHPRCAFKLYDEVNSVKKTQL